MCATPTALKLYRRFGHGLKMCILFVYKHQIIFVNCLQDKFSHFSGVITFKKYRDSGYSFIQFVLKLYICYVHGLKMCICLNIVLRLFLLLLSQDEFSRFLGIYYDQSDQI